MNIKIVDPLQDFYVMHRFPFGSHVYGTAKPTSDKDFLCIVNFDAGVMPLHYKTPETDLVYTDFKNLLRGLSDGGEPVFFEVVHTKEFQEIYRLDVLKYYHPWNAKMYLGIAKRDIRFLERIHHVNRCIWMAKKILAKELIVLADVAKIEIRTDTKALMEEIIAIRKGIVYA